MLKTHALATLLLVAVSTAGCFPAAGWTAAGYTTDVTKTSQGELVVGHCFRMRYDAYVITCPRHIELHGGGTVDVAGCLRLITPGSSTSHRVDLPKGSQVVVEKVLEWQNVETSSLTPYIRVNGALIDANDLFRLTGSSEHHKFGLINSEHLLDPCEGGK